MQENRGKAGVNGTQLYFEVTGSGSPLVLIHGNTLDIRMWDDQIELFASQYQVIRYEMRGFGRSAAPTAEPYAPVDDLKALLSHLGVEHANILGLSLGGAIAIDFALAYPEMTDTLIVAGAGLREFQWPTYGEFVSGVRSAAMTAGIDLARQRWLEGALFLPALEQPALAARLTQMVADYSGWHWLNKEQLLPPDAPVKEQLGAVDIPTLVIVGERDIEDFHAVADFVHARIPGAMKVVMPGVGHLSNMEDPAHFNTLVLDFLAAHSGSQR